jgi:hypothetical protein
MKKNVLVFGTIVGVIMAGIANYAAHLCCTNPKFETNDVLGYAAMLATFSLIFVAVKNFRDKYNNGFITFGKAFKTGAYISLVASTIYVGVWLVDYYIFIPDFIDSYTTHVLHEAGRDGASAKELEQKAVEMAEFKDQYKNPLFVVVVSYAEVLPIALIISLISAAFLMKKPKTIVS